MLRLAAARSRRLLTLVLVLELVSQTIPRAQAGTPAQQTVTVTVVAGPSAVPGPTTSPAATCIRTRDANDQPQDAFLYKGMMRVFLAAGCAGSLESHIEVDVASSLVLFTFVDADVTGGFDTTVQHLPASVLPGPHEVVVKTIEHTYRAPITVLPSSGGESVGGGGGSSVLGGSVRRRPLPHTGEEIARLLSLALGLVFVGAGLRLATRARRRAREPAA
jgi:hypothetical protein